MSTPPGLQLWDGLAILLLSSLKKILPKDRSRGKHSVWCLVTTPALIRTENWVRYTCSALWSLTIISLEIFNCFADYFGISQVQDHATIPIMPSVEKLFVFSFLWKRQVVTYFLKRNARYFSKTRVAFRKAKNKNPVNWVNIIIFS